MHSPISLLQVKLIYVIQKPDNFRPFGVYYSIQS